VVAAPKWEIWEYWTYGRREKLPSGCVKFVDIWSPLPAVSFWSSSPTGIGG